MIVDSDFVAAVLLLVFLRHALQLVDLQERVFFVVLLIIDHGNFHKKTKNFDVVEDRNVVDDDSDDELEIHVDSIDLNSDYDNHPHPSFDSVDSFSYCSELEREAFYPCKKDEIEESY